MDNVILLKDTDSYKASHPLMINPDVKQVFSSLYWRGVNKEESFDTNYVLAVGMTKAIEQLPGYFKPFTKEEIKEVKLFFTQHVSEQVGKDNKFFDLLEGKRLTNLVNIWTVPEGTWVPERFPIIAVESIDPDVPTFGQYIETRLMRIHSQINTATISGLVKYRLKQLWDLYSDADPQLLNFALHDFGSRGASCEQEAKLNGRAHLVNFWGSDTCAAMMLNTQEAYSVAAAEHSTIMSYPREIDAYTHILNTFKTGIVSIVIDTYNTIEAAKMFTNELKDLVLNRDGKVVLRPDSGDPQKISIEVLNILWEGFGGTYNSKGLRVLNPKVGLIWGDGMNISTACNFVDNVCYHGFAPENVVIGMGGGLLAKHNRDTFNFCFKPGAFNFGDGWVSAQKKSEDEMKVSLPGRVFTGPNNTLVNSPEESIMEVPKLKFNFEILIEARERAQKVPADLKFIWDFE